MQNAVRLMAPSINIGVSATLKSEVFFTCLDGEKVTIPTGTRVHMDEHKGFASWQGYHFTLEADEYSIDFSN